MEKALLIAGRILAVLFGAAAAVVLTMLVVGTTLVNAVVTIPATAVQTLSEENFLAESGQIAVRAMFASLPETIEVRGFSIPRAELLSTLAQADIRTIAQRLVSREWLITQLDSAFDRVVSNSPIVQDNRLIQLALRGVQGHEVALMLVEAARNCSESEITTLINLVNPDLLNKPVVNFICNPPDRADVDLKAAMRGLVVAVLPLIADRLSERIPNPFEELQLPELAIDTPIGVLSVDGLTLHLSLGSLDLSYSLRSAAPETANASALGASTLVLASNLAQEVPTEETPDAAVRPGIEATEAAEASSSEDSDAGAVAKLRDTLETLKLRLAELAVSINQILIGGFGVLLILLTIEVLFFVRTLRALGIWLGGVLLASGVLILLMHARFSSNGGIGTVYSAPDGALGPAVMEIRANLTDAISSAVQSQLGNPLQISGIVLALVGVAVLGGLLYSIRRAQS